MQSVATKSELDAALEAPLALLYKHSDTCAICTMAWHEVVRATAERPELPVYVLDVRAQRALAREVAERLDVRHESPQAILLRAGTPVWHASHYGVTARALERAMAEYG
jgi:bacillithiol system protein YtxJ